PVRPGRSGTAGRAVAPAAAADVTGPAVAGAPRHDPHMAPRPARTPPRRSVASQATWPPPHTALDPCPGAAPGAREQELGISAGPWRAAGTRAAGTRGQGRPVH